MDRKDGIFTVLNVVIALFIVSLLFRTQLFQLSSRYTRLNYLGILVASCEFILNATYYQQSLQFLYTLSPLIVAGSVTGVVLRRPSKAVKTSIFGGLLIATIYDVAFILYPLPLKQFTNLPLHPFLLLNIINGFLAGVLTSFFAYLISKPITKEKLPQLPNVYDETITSTCPNCDTLFYSHPKYCSSCGTLLKNSQE